MDILDLLRSDGSIIINKKLSHKIGVMENIVLSELISQYKYFQSRNELDEEGYFYCTVDKMEKHTALSKDQQSRAINNLVKLGLIKKDLKGLPARRHFYICEKEIMGLFLDNYNNNDENADDPRHVQIEENPQTGSSKTRQQESGKSSNIHNNINNNLEEEETRADTRENSGKEKLSSKIIEKFKEVFSRKPSSFEKKQLSVTQCSENIILKALEITGLNSKNRTIGYTIALLSDWTSKGLKTIEEVEKMIREFNNSSNTKKNKKSSSNKSTVPKRSLEEMYADGWR